MFRWYTIYPMKQKMEVIFEIKIAVAYDEMLI